MISTIIISSISTYFARRRRRGRHVLNQKCTHFKQYNHQYNQQHSTGRLEWLQFRDVAKGDLLSHLLPNLLSHLSPNLLSHPLPDLLSHLMSHRTPCLTGSHISPLRSYLNSFLITPRVPRPPTSSHSRSTFSHRTSRLTNSRRSM